MTQPTGQTFRVFVSSTFSDLKAERDALQAHVFPRLRELCERHGARFQAIDLRWGVSQQASRDQQTMNICLGEIARCQDVTPRPNFIVLLGDRYGWCPPPPQIPAKEFKALSEHVPTEDQPLVTEWYRHDDNAKPAEYVLQPWDGYTYEEWSDIEDRLHAALEHAAEQAGLGEKVRFKYWASATHQEIDGGALRVDDPEKKVFAFFRKIEEIGELPAQFEAEPFLRNLAERASKEHPELVADAAARRRLTEILQMPAGATAGEVNEHIRALLAKAEEEAEAAKLLKQVQAWLHKAVAKDYQDLDDETLLLDQEAGERLTDQKAQLESRVPVVKYDARWEGQGPSTEHIGSLPEEIVKRLPEEIEACLAAIDASDLPDTLCARVWRKLARAILTEIENPTELSSGPEEIHVVPDEVLDPEGQAHCDFANALLHHFVGREGPLSAIRDYLAGDEGRTLAVVAEGGSGKSALMAKALEQAQTAHSDAQIVYRFIGATPSSSDGRSLLHGLCREISRRYGEDEEVPYDYTDLVPELGKRMSAASTRRPLILFLDALDQLSEAHGARRLTWLPRRLPENVRVVVSTRRQEETFEAAKQHQPQEIELKAMSRQDGAKLLRLWLKDAGRTEDTGRRLTKEQREAVLDAFEHEASGGRPLYLKLAFEEARLWASYAPPEHLEPGMEGVIRKNLFHRLSREENHGDELVARTVGYLAASRYGLAEDELLDVLSQDVDLYTAFLEGSFHVPSDLVERAIEYRRSHGMDGGTDESKERELAEGWLLDLAQHPARADALRRFLDKVLPGGQGPRLPVVLWSRLYFDLEPYLTKRMSEGAPLLGFYHRELEDVGNQEYAGDGRGRTLHRRLADYFRFRADPDGNATWNGNDVRGLGELSYHLIEAARWQEVHDTLSDFNFLQAKTTVVGIQHLIEDYGEVDRSGHERRDLSLVQNALQLSARVLVQDDTQLAGQLVGRLMTQETPAIQSLMQQAKDWKAAPWLRPLAPTLIQAGGPLIRSLEGHTSPVAAVAVTSDGTRAVSGSWDKTLRVWDLQTGEALYILEGHTGTVFAIVVSPEGSRAVSAADKDKTLKVWDLDSGEELHTLRGHTGQISTVAMTPDGACAVSGATDNTLRVWDINSGKVLRTLEGHLLSVSAVAVTPDGQCVVSASRNWKLKVWALETGEVLHTLAGHTGAVLTVAVTPDGTRAISGSDDNTLMVWELDSGETLHTLKGHDAEVREVVLDSHIAISGSLDGTLKVWDLHSGKATRTMNGRLPVALMPDGGRAISAFKDGSLKIWDLRSGNVLYTLAGHTNYVDALAVTLDGTRAVSGSRDQTLKVWNLASGEDESQVGQPLKEHTAGVRAVAVTPDGQRAVSGASDHTLRVWDLRNGDELHILAGHMGEVLTVAVTPDGTRAVSGSGDCTLKVWRLESGEELGTLEGHQDKVGVVAVTPDGTRAVSGSKDNTVKVWHLESGEELGTLEGHQDEVGVVAVTPDGTRAVSGSKDNTVKVWDLESGEEIHTLEGHTKAVNALAVTPDGIRGVSGSDDCTLKVWDLERGEELHRLTGHNDRISAVALTPDGNRAVSAAFKDKNLKVWDLERGAELHTLVGHTWWVWTVAVTHDGRRAVSGSFDNTLRVWDLETGEQLSCLAGHTEWIWAVAVTPDGQRAVSASHDCTLRVWNLELDREVHSSTRYTGFVNAVAVTPDGCRAVSGGLMLKVWDLETGDEVRTLKGHVGEVNAVAVTPDGRRAVSAPRDGTLKVWDLESGEKIHTLEGHTRAVNAVAITADGRRAVSGSQDETLKVWDLKSGEAVHTLEGHARGIKALAVTQDGTRAVSGSFDNALIVWDLESGRDLHSLTGHTSWVSSVAVTPDGTHIVSGSDDCTLKVWHLESGEELGTLVGHQDRVRVVAVTSDGICAISGSKDCTLKVWDLQTGKALHTLEGHKGPVTDMRVTADGHRAVSTSGDGTVRVWDLETGEDTAVFTMDSEVRTVVAVAGNGAVFVGDRARTGQVHILHLENVA